MTKTFTLPETKPNPPTPEQYQDAMRGLAFSFCPPIYACRKCSWPVVLGYCCTTCGTGDPRSAQDDDESV